MQKQCVKRVKKGSASAVMLAALFGLLSLMDAATGLAGDQVRGATLFNQKCSYCHSLSERSRPMLAVPKRHPGSALPGRGEPDIDWPVEVGQDKRGPHLQGLFGRAPGAVEGFPYRITLQTDNVTWTEPDLDYWIYNHARLREAERADLIAYLRQATRR